MGKRDSTKTRVIPVFDYLMKNYNPEEWLKKLISLPQGCNSVSLQLTCKFSIMDYGWGVEEKKLDPPVALLSWLIRHPRKPLSGNLSNNPEVAQKRLEWIEGSEKMQINGLSLLRRSQTRKDWHIFEGQTQPDVFIQTPDIIVVVEGKRTEKKPTISTKWMAGRNQMLRHIDCAWEIASGRKIIGFFIVEGNNADGEVPTDWNNFAKQTVTTEAIASSLPHRGPEEQRGIASSFVGVTTWQRLCKEFKISWSMLPDLVDE